MPNFQFSRRANWPCRENILSAPQRGQKIIVNQIKQTCFSLGLDKAFHLPEFQAKLFFTRNWAGGFYWDSLLIIIFQEWFKSHSGRDFFQNIYSAYMII